MADSGESALLERDFERGAVERLLESARRGEGGLAVIEGPAGIGKSTLLAAATGHAGELGFGVSDARGSPLEEELSFGIAAQALEAPIQEMPDGDRERLFTGAAAIVRPMFDPGEGAPTAGATIELDTSLAVLNGLYWIVADLADSNPLLLAIDDAHWADEASLRFLHFLVQRSADLAVAVVVAVRTGEPGEERALAELTHHPSADVLTLEPLSKAAVERVVSAELPEAERAFCEACADLTAGNPYYLRALLTAVHEERMPATTASAHSLSRLGRRAIGRAVLSRLGRMPPPHRALARAATVLVDGAPLHHVATLAGLDAAEAATASDSLAEANVFERGDPVGFAHPLVREAIYAELSAAERGRGHRLAARLLADEHAAPEMVATHLLQAEHGAERWAVDALSAAAERVRSRGDPAAAAQYLDRALSEGGGLERRGEILFQLGLVEAMRGQPRGEELILEAAAEIPDPNARAFALMNLARILGVGGRYGESARTFRRASEVLAGTGSELTWWAEAGYAMSGSLDPATRREAAPLLERALEDPGLDVLEQLPIGRSTLAFAALERVNAAHPAPGVAALARRVASQKLGDIDDNGVAYRIAASVLAMCGEFDEAERIADAMLAAAHQQGSAVEIAGAAYPRLQLALQLGRPAEVIRDATIAIDGLRLGFGVAVPVTHVALFWGHLERGEIDAAQGALELPGGDERWRGDYSLAFLGTARGTLQLARGDAAGALGIILDAGAELTSLGVVNPALSPFPWQAIAAMAAARLGERDQALALAEAELALAERFGIARSIGAALRTRGLVEGREQGLDWLRRSIERLDGTPYELELARSLVELGAALRRSGARRDARDPLRRGAALAHGCGALALAARGQDELRATGAKPRRLVVSGVDSLTASERRIADLAASGLTNRQIAEQLFLSKKTVETHLGSVYRKLEVGREELGGALGTGEADSQSTLVEA